MLSWFEICIKSIDEDKLEIDDRKKVSAIRYVNNKKKHSISVFKYNISKKSRFPSSSLYPSKNLYPSKFKIYWKELPFYKEKEFKGQWKNYNNFLKGKNLIDSSKEIFEIVKNRFN